MTNQEEIKLTFKEQRFVDFYTTVARFNATRAHELAGFKAKNNNVRRVLACKLLAKGNIQAKIKEVLNKEHEENIVLKTKIRRLYEMVHEVTIDKFLVFGAEPVDGSRFDQSFVVLKNMEDINPEYIDCIKKVKQTNQGYEIELYSKFDAAAELRKMYGFDAPTKHEVKSTVQYSFVDLVRKANEIDK